MLSKQMKNQKPKQRSSYRGSFSQYSRHHWLQPERIIYPCSQFLQCQSRPKQSLICNWTQTINMFLERSTLNNTDFKKLKVLWQVWQYYENSYQQERKHEQKVLSRRLLCCTHYLWWWSLSFFGSDCTFDDIQSLFEFKYQEFLMRSCFGYTKYCENFFYGN